MTTRIQLRRTATSGTVPVGLMPGEVAINEPDRILFFGDASSATQTFLGVKVFAVTASYAIGDLVNNGGVIYQATAAMGPGAWTPSNWKQVSLPSGNIVGTPPLLLQNDGLGNLTWISWATLDGGTF